MPDGTTDSGAVQRTVRAKSSPTRPNSVILPEFVGFAQHSGGLFSPPLPVPVSALPPPRLITPASSAALNSCAACGVKTRFEIAPGVFKIADCICAQSKSRAL